MDRLKHFFRPTLFGLSLLLFFTTGCVNKLRMTEPARSLGEQLLLSTSIDRSLSELDTEAIGRLKGFKVFISSEYLKTLDQEYLLGSLRDLFLSNGVLVVDKAEEAQMIVEVRSGANSLDSSTATLGIAEDQALPNPVTGAPVALPEISFFKRENNFAVSKVALVAYQAKSREHIFSSGTLLGGAYDRHFQFLGMIRLRFTDVPELRALKQLKRRYR
ncbi:MAG: hypothetical protein OXS32_06145 [Verrucomicrobiales bacterium]|nr:hypothetical protein [Verrucomicrobiales bacterium]